MSTQIIVGQVNDQLDVISIAPEVLNRTPISSIADQYKNAYDCVIVTDSENLPPLLFRSAWEIFKNTVVVANVSKSKEIAASIYRAQRASEFAPLDQLISAQIPGTDTAEIERQRQSIRDKYETIQQSIERASTIDEIISALSGGNNAN